MQLILCTNLLLVGAYLISQIPLPEFGLGRNDYEDLGFGLQRDLSSYSEDYYPDDEVNVHGTHFTFTHMNSSGGV